MRLSYKVIKGHRAGVWYYEVYAHEGNEQQKIRAGNTPYPTKREAEKQGEAKVQELAAQHAARQTPKQPTKKYYGKHGDERPNRKTTYGYKHGRKNEYHVSTLTRDGRYQYQDVNAYGQDGVRSAKQTGQVRARGSAYKNVVYNRTRKHYVGKNRAR